MIDTSTYKKSLKVSALFLETSRARRNAFTFSNLGEKRFLATGAKIPVRRNDQTFSRRPQNHQTLFRTKEQDPSTLSVYQFSHERRNPASTRSGNTIQFGNCLMCPSASASFRKIAGNELESMIEGSQFSSASNQPGAT